MSGVRHDVLVVGAGPAGATAAIAAAQNGLSVAVLDENAAAGGQVFRAPFAGATNSPDQAKGDRLRAALRRSSALHLPGRSVWHVAPGFTVEAGGLDGLERLEADRLILATGTTERILPMPGADLPGVIGLAATTIAIKAHGTIPAGPTLVAGVGPLLYAVAAGLLAAGGRVAAVLDLAGPADWFRALPDLAVRPDLLRQGLGWVGALRRASVPIHFRHTVTRIEAADHCLHAWTAPVEASWRARGGSTRFAVRNVALGHGLTPAPEVARLLKAVETFRPEEGGWVPVLDAAQRSSVHGLYIAGDCSGVRGSAAAELAGRLAGLAAARDAGRLNADEFDTEARPLRRKLARARRFGGAVARLMAPRPGLLAQTTAGTIVCRCEDVTRAAIEDAVSRGARHMNQLKAATRCGMGPCQGRICGEAVAEILAESAGIDRCDAGRWTTRPPLRPLTVGTLAGRFDLGDNTGRPRHRPERASRAS